MESPLKQLINTLPQEGKVTWIGVRPARKAPMRSVQSVGAFPESGLEGDRYRRTASPRQITLLQAEHLSVVEVVLGRGSIPPELLRRNVVVRSINLLALKAKDVWVGPVEMSETEALKPRLDVIKRGL